MTPAREATLAAEILRLQNALAAISLATQRNDSPAYVIVEQVGREARAALGKQ